MTGSPQFGFALRYVPDVEAAKRFYVNVVGLEVQRDHPQFVQFDRFAVASDESVGGTNEPELYWLVDDAEAAFARLSTQAEITVPLREMPFGKVFAVRDPAGHSCYILQFAAERPSRAI